MPYVVTRSCCSDASCVYACPVNCIHPTPDEPDFGTAEMLHVDPAACVDCGACVSACPVDAIVPHTALRADQQQFLTINADFYRAPRPRAALAPVAPAAPVRGRGLRVAIVGSGPAAMYAADELLTQPGVRVDVYERLAAPYGLARFGVATDHTETRQVSRLFDTIAAQPGFRLHLGVDVGTDLTHDDLLADHHAVLYAVGASAERRLDVPGAELAVPATEFVAWYNGHPYHAGRSYDLSHPRVVIIGNGNVALDVARILTLDPERLTGTDIAPHALDALRASRVEEVVVVARRGVAQSAFTVPELAGLLAVPDVDVVLDSVDAVLDPESAAAERDDTLPHAVAQKLRLLRTAPTAGSPGRRRIVLRYLAAPSRISSSPLVESSRAAKIDSTSGEDVQVGLVRTGFDGQPAGEVEPLEAGLVLTSIGYRGRPVAGLPFDEARGVVPNEGGRVEPGTYVAGWIKRGPSGFIGTNKSCAQETVRALVADFNAGLLHRAVRPIPA